MNTTVHLDPYATAPDLEVEVKAVAALTVEHARRRRERAYIPPTDEQHLALRQAAVLDRSALADPDNHLAAAAALHAALVYKDLTFAAGSPIEAVRRDYLVYRDGQRLPIGAPTVSQQLAKKFQRAKTVYGDGAGRLAPRLPGFVARSRYRAVEVDHLGGSEEERADQRAKLAQFLRERHGYTVVEAPMYGSTVLRVTRYPATEGARP
ncbi:hypothetical protein [Kitasatospora sp. HPMI-4]|uniref:hypothetical protein n=1 Tax=Kitasatospora sp. HPMI-4 TaxID=3448443 RepID=UPI003F1D380F